MALFIKETVTSDRIVSSVKRFSLVDSVPQSQEEVLLLWINKSCEELKKRIETELKEKDDEVRFLTIKLKFTKLYFWLG